MSRSGIGTVAVLALSTGIAGAQGWSGAYGGVNLSAATGTVDVDGTGLQQTIGFGGAQRGITVNPFTGAISGSEDLDGALFGAQVGYRWQAGAFVYGFEGGVRFGEVGYSGEIINPPQSVEYEFSVDRLIDLRGTLGYAVSDDWLVFGSLGFVQATSTTQFNFSGGLQAGSDDNIRDGFSVGLGAERRLTDRLSLTGEIVRYDLGSARYVGDDGFGTVISINQDVQFTEIRVGLNIRF